MKSRLFVASADIERETGFGRDQLRKWRQRFQFPPLEFTAEGKPGYSVNTVNQLRLVKRLLDGGFRPGYVVGKTLEELERLHVAVSLSVPGGFADESTSELIEQLKKADSAGFLKLLVKKRAKKTLLQFSRSVVAPLLKGLGDAWARGDVEIHHEHFFSFCIERYFHAQILRLKPKRGAPKILMALPPGEHHFLGLLMIEAVFAEQGAMTVSLGSDIPLNELERAATSHNVDAVALSFSAAYPARDILPTLKHLRRLLPRRIPIWAGGATLAGIKNRPTGVSLFPELDGVVAALNDMVDQMSVR